MEYSIDSCPIILAKGSHSKHGKVAQKFKLHAIVIRRPGQLPVPVSLIAFGAAQHDLPVAKQIVEDTASLKPGKLFADKAYIDAEWRNSLKLNHALELLTPRKKY